MKVTVFGASGGTGSEVVRQALASGHEVIAVVRDPARLPHQANPHLEVVAADVMNPASIQDAVTGRDAVISTIGSRNPRAPTTVSAGRARSIVTAMRAAGMRRLVAVSGTGATNEGDGPLLRYIAKPIGNLFLAIPRQMCAQTSPTSMSSSRPPGSMTPSE